MSAHLSAAPHIGSDPIGTGGRSRRRTRGHGKKAASLAILLALTAPSLPARASQPGGGGPVVQNPASPPSKVSTWESERSGPSFEVGFDYLEGWVESQTTLPRVEGGPPAQRRTCVGGRREQIDVEVRIVRREEGCLVGVDSYRFDPIEGEATAAATVPTTLETWTYTRPKESEPWMLEAYRRSTSSVTIDLGWTARGAPFADSWVCVIYGPPYVWPCPKEYVVASVQYADVTGSVDFTGLDAGLSPTSGTMAWGVFLP